MEGKPGLTMVDLFAGCGGLSLGMENAGFVPIYVNELNADAMASYLANRHHVLGGKPFADQPHLHSRDVHKLRGQELEKVARSLQELGIQFPSREEASRGRGASTLDLLAGGPPCQGFSGIGHRRSYGVDKKDIPSNQLYQRMTAIIRRLRPRIFLFENVRGLLNAKWTTDGDARIWPDVLEEFRSIPGYEVRWSLVHSSDYGVPQNRPRVLLVGVRDDIARRTSLLDLGIATEDAVAAGFLPKSGLPRPPGLEALLGDLVDEKVMKYFQSGEYPRGKFETTSYPRRPQNAVQRKLRAPAPSHEERKGVELTDHGYSRHAQRIVAKFKHMIENNGEIPTYARTRKFSQRVLKKSWGNGLPNITATSMPDDYVHFQQPRTLTVREWARLQLFPDWYQFKGKRTTGGLRRAGNPRAGNFERDVPKYTQIGNAVPVELAERVGKHFKRILDEAVEGDGSGQVQ